MSYDDVSRSEAESIARGVARDAADEVRYDLGRKVEDEARERRAGIEELRQEIRDLREWITDK